MSQIDPDSAGVQGRGTVPDGLDDAERSVKEELHDNARPPSECVKELPFVHMERV